MRPCDQQSRAWFWAWLAMAVFFLVFAAAAALRAENWGYALVCTVACGISLRHAAHAR